MLSKKATTYGEEVRWKNVGVENSECVGRVIVDRDIKWRTCWEWVDGEGSVGWAKQFPC